jgi:ElaB/YqjD/DUF883 family membrane-anchored ribosome-binding protein
MSMLARKWLEENVVPATEAAHAKFAAASDALVNQLQSTRSALSRSGSAGVDYARQLSNDVTQGTYRFGRSTRTLVAERPIESVMIIGAAAFAVGWLWRRSRERGQ